jgi:hypothetical protein
VIAQTDAVSSYLGHASVTITLDRYGQLIPGNENEAATLLAPERDVATATAPLPPNSSTSGSSATISDSTTVNAILLTTSERGGDDVHRVHGGGGTLPA